MRKNLIAAVLLLAVAPVLQAQVRVVESAPRSFGSGAASPSTNAAIESDVYSQIRALQEEIATLRGMLEEQSYEVKQLKQLQLDNYMDIDRRLSSARNAAPGQEATTNIPPSITPVASSLSASSAPIAEPSATKPLMGEDELYSHAYDLLNQRQYDTSVSSFKEYLTHYPEGKYASNCYYWLGKVAMLQQDYPQAKTWFNDLISRFPQSQKVAGSQLDLGRVLFFMGEKDQSKQILGQVAGGNSEAAPLARKFLTDNF